MTDEKRDFMRDVLILVDTREQQNKHITAALEGMGVSWVQSKLDYGDYSFIMQDKKQGKAKDFSRPCVIERKANVGELYGNVVADRGRIEKEFDTVRHNATQCTLLLENCASWEELRSYEISDSQMQAQARKVKNIGAVVYATLRSWQCGNRYGFQVEFVKDKSRSAAKIMELFFWYWHNYKKQTAARK